MDLKVTNSPPNPIYPCPSPSAWEWSIDTSHLGSAQKEFRAEPIARVSIPVASALPVLRTEISKSSANGPHKVPGSQRHCILLFDALTCHLFVSLLCILFLYFCLFYYSTVLLHHFHFSLSLFSNFSFFTYTFYNITFIFCLFHNEIKIYWS